MTTEGVDYTTDARPSIASLLANSKQFACRYGGPGGAWKQLTTSERDELHAAGIAIVANAEGLADGLKGGYSAGQSWAQSALTFWNAMGLPSDRPIYFSADFNTTSGDWNELDAAFDGAASVIGRNRVGVYGEYDLIAHFVGNGKAKWFWQTYAWSLGKVHPSAHLYQYRNGVSMGGGTVDLDRAMVNDYGQWTGDDMELTDVVKLPGYGGNTQASAIVNDTLAYTFVRAAMAEKSLGRIEAALAQLTARIPPDNLARLQAILAAAQDDTNTTVTMDPATLTEFKAAVAALEAVHVPTADEVVDELHTRLES